MKRLIATASVLFVLCAASSADAGIMYGNRFANRLSSGNNGISRFFRSVGQAEFRKDVYLFGRPLGNAPAQYCPHCGRPMSEHGGHYHY